MPLTSAERSKLWRERKKNNPEEYRAYLQKEKERYNKRKEKGEIKSIQELSNLTQWYTPKWVANILVEEVLDQHAAFGKLEINENHGE